MTPELQEALIEGAAATIGLLGVGPIVWLLVVFL